MIKTAKFPNKELFNLITLIISDKYDSTTKDEYPSVTTEFGNMILDILKKYQNAENSVAILTDICTVILSDHPEIIVKQIKELQQLSEQERVKNNKLMYG